MESSFLLVQLCVWYYASVLAALWQHSWVGRSIYDALGFEQLVYPIELWISYTGI